jgi:hypothetical protein
VDIRTTICLVSIQTLLNKRNSFVLLLFKFLFFN